jgi:hypothetical protein
MEGTMKKKLCLAALLVALGVGITATCVFPPDPELTGKFGH